MTGGHMKHAIFLPPFDGLADVERMADLAVLAEGSGWDGFFVWDHLRYASPVRDILDPYVCLAVMAARTGRRARPSLQGPSRDGIRYWR